MKAPPTSKKASPPATLHSWLTRAGAGKVLGITANGVRALEMRGKLKSTVDGDGAHRFNPAEVHELSLRRRQKKQRASTTPINEGALEARVFELLDLYADAGERDGRKIQSMVVKELGVTSDLFLRYYEAWSTNPDDRIRDRRRAEKEALLMAARNAEAELKARLDIERMRVEKEEKRRDVEFMKGLRRRAPYGPRSKLPELPVPVELAPKPAPEEVPISAAARRRLEGEEDDE